MNKKRRRIYFLISFILLTIISLFGCNKTEEEQEKNKLDIENGAIVLEGSEGYEIYNLIDGKYQKVDTEYIITSYDLQSGNFIYNENGEIKVSYLGKGELIEDGKTIISPKLSRGGNYLAYFVKEDYLNLNIKDLSKNTNIQIDSNVAISGNLIEWINEDTLVYYGIDENKNNGIFTYNISEREEKLLYKLDLGYVEFLKVLDDGIVFVQEKEGKQKLLKIIDENGEVKDVIKNIVDVSDVESTTDGIFILGKLEDNNYSLYKYKDGKAKRLVFDFPKLIDLKKGLSKDKNGNIIFIGSDENYKEEKVYICEDDAISIINSNLGVYHFIECN